MEFVHDPNILACISLRENLIKRARQIVALSGTVRSKHVSSAARELVTLSKDLREIGVKTVARIVSWSLEQRSTFDDPDSEPPPQYIYEGEDYLCKMLTDLDFVASGLPENLLLHGKFSISDPLFIKKDISADLASRRAATAATLVILDAVSRKKKAEELAHMNKEKSEAQNMRKGSLSKIRSIGHLKRVVSHVMMVPRRSKSVMKMDTDKDNSPQHGHEGILVGSIHSYQLSSKLGEGAFSKVRHSNTIHHNFFLYLFRYSLLPDISF